MFCKYFRKRFWEIVFENYYPFWNHCQIVFNVFNVFQCLYSGILNPALKIQSHCNLFALILKNCVIFSFFWSKSKRNADQTHVRLPPDGSIAWGRQMWQWGGQRLKCLIREAGKNNGNAKNVHCFTLIYTYSSWQLIVIFRIQCPIYPQ